MSRRQAMKSLLPSITDEWKRPSKSVPVRWIRPLSLGQLEH
jgi:hypothetical protein